MVSDDGLDRIAAAQPQPSIIWSTWLKAIFFDDPKYTLDRSAQVLGDTRAVAAPLSETLAKHVALFYEKL
jgi:hypothetical protein